MRQRNGDLGFKTILALALGTVFVSSAVQARNDLLRLPLAEALSTPDAKAKLDPKIRMYFGKQKYPAPTRQAGTFTANKKTNFFNKTDKEGCQWAFLSAAISMQSRARELGVNAIVNMRSVYKDAEFASETEYECSAGNIAGGVALRGEFVALP
jgi:hypothetical protein